MRMYICTVQEMYLPGFECTYVRYKCISDEDIVETGQVGSVSCTVEKNILLQTLF